MMSRSFTEGITEGIQASDRRRGYVLTAGILLIIMLGGTLPRRSRTPARSAS